MSDTTPVRVAIIFDDDSVINVTDLTPEQDEALNDFIATVPFAVEHHIEVDDLIDLMNL